jgi:serine/threonine protein kinase
LTTLLEQKNTIMTQGGIDNAGMCYLTMIKRLILSTIGALMPIHVTGTLHRDVRLSNYIIKDGSVVLIDYGLATRMERPSNSALYCVNAPEVIAGQEYSMASEMWSLGIVLLSLWTCTKPFDRGAQTDTQVSILTLCY